MPKTTQGELLQMKKNIIESCVAKTMRWKDGAVLLGMHPKALSRLKKEYMLRGEVALTGAKPGPKSGSSIHNRTSETTEKLVVELARNFKDEGPIGLSDRMHDLYGISVEQTTIWRILTRTKTRYTQGYVRWKSEPKLYALDTPGQEVQIDACFPFGRSRPLACFEAIDDCSRWLYGKCYEHEDAESVIAFLSELINRVPFRIQAIRVDNRYGKKLRDFCSSLDITLIENDPYSPQQNGKVERVHKTSKTGFFLPYTAFSDSLEEVNYKYSLWVSHYNYNRRHQGYKMGRLTPAQKLYTCYLAEFSNRGTLEPQKVTGILQQYIFCHEITE